MPMPALPSPASIMSPSSPPTLEVAELTRKLEIARAQLREEVRPPLSPCHR
jgi:hypothetical protein